MVNLDLRKSFILTKAISEFSAQKFRPVKYSAILKNPQNFIFCCLASELNITFPYCFFPSLCGGGCVCIVVLKPLAGQDSCPFLQKFSAACKGIFQSIPRLVKGFCFTNISPMWVLQMPQWGLSVPVALAGVTDLCVRKVTLEEKKLHGELWGLF